MKRSGGFILRPTRAYYYPYTVRSAIVVALWAVASDQIVQIFKNAMAPFLSGSL